MMVFYIYQGEWKLFMAKLKYNWFDLQVYTMTTACHWPFCLWLMWFSSSLCAFLASSTRRSVNCLFH